MSRVALVYHDVRAGGVCPVMGASAAAHGAAASLLWPLGPAYGAGLLAPLFRDPLIGVIMGAIAFGPVPSAGIP